MRLITFKKKFVFGVFISNEVSYVSSCRRLNCIITSWPNSSWAQTGHTFTVPSPPNICQNDRWRPAPPLTLQLTALTLGGVRDQSNKGRLQFPYTGTSRTQAPGLTKPFIFEASYGSSRTLVTYRGRRCHLFYQNARLGQVPTYLPRVISGYCGWEFRRNRRLLPW